MVKKTVTLKLKYRSSEIGKLREFKCLIPVKKLYFVKWAYKIIKLFIEV